MYEKIYCAYSVPGPSRNLHPLAPSGQRCAERPTRKSSKILARAKLLRHERSKDRHGCSAIRERKQPCTLVPLRFMSNSLGVADSGVQWDDKTQTATITGGSTLKFTIGSNSYTVNGTKKTMDTTPVLNSDRVMLPARYVAEALGYDVMWNEDAQAVTMVPHGESTLMHDGKTYNKPEGVRIMESVLGIKTEIPSTLPVMWGAWSNDYWE